MAGAPWSPYSCGLMAGALANLDQAAEAAPLLAKLRAEAYSGPVGLAIYYLALGDIESAGEWAQKAVDTRFPSLITRVIRAHQSLLRRSAAWPGLFKTMNLA